MLVESKIIISETHFTEYIPLTTHPNNQPPLLRLNAICPYSTMLPFELPFNALKAANTEKWFFTTFCERGTTNCTTRRRGFPREEIDLIATLEWYCV